MTTELVIQVNMQQICQSKKKKAWFQNSKLKAVALVESNFYCGK